MKVTFSKSEMYTLKGCYKNETLEACSFMQTDSPYVTLPQILDSEIHLSDKLWFCGESTGLTGTEKRRLALLCAKAALPIYERAHPDDKRVRECVNVTERHLDGNSTYRELSSALDCARDAGYASEDDADAEHVSAAAYAAAYAASAAASSSASEVNPASLYHAAGRALSKNPSALIEAVKEFCSII